MTFNAPSIAGLPPVLARFAEATSVDLALRLAGEHGGITRYIPIGVPGDDHWLVRCVGKAGAQALAEQHGGCWLAIPKAEHLRSKKALIAAAKGTTREIARRFGVTDRYVRMVREKGSSALLSRGGGQSLADGTAGP